MSLIKISESDDWIVDYDKECGMYRVSYFEDGHLGTNIGLMLMKKKK